MSLFSNPEEHNANPPSTWRVVKGSRDATGAWWLTDKSGVAQLEKFRTKRDAIMAVTTGACFSVRLWLKERRWYAGESVEDWKPYASLAPHA